MAGLDNSLPVTPEVAVTISPGCLEPEPAILAS